MSTFWLCFVPLFVAADPIGLLPIYLALTEGLTPERRRRVLIQSLITALAVALAFLFVGDWTFTWLGITNGDFMVAGGALLFILSLRDLLSGRKVEGGADAETMGAVPLGVPLIVGPGFLSTVLLLAGRHGVWPTVGATAANIFAAGLILHFAEALCRLLGKAGVQTLSKIFNLVLAAIAVMMVRHGLQEIIGHWH